MSTHRWDDETREVIKAAIRIAAAPPLTAHKYADTARVPWTAVTDLRAALDAAGVDWRRVK